MENTDRIDIIDIEKSSELTSEEMEEVKGGGTGKITDLKTGGTGGGSKTGGTGGGSKTGGTGGGSKTSGITGGSKTGSDTGA